MDINSLKFDFRGVSTNTTYKPGIYLVDNKIIQDEVMNVLDKIIERKQNKNDVYARYKIPPFTDTRRTILEE